MLRPSRLGAAATIAALGASLATPGIEAASATTAVPALPNVSTLVSALTQLGASSANAQTIVQDLTALQSASSTSQSLSALQTLDTNLANDVPGLGPLLGGVVSLLGNTLSDVLGGVLNLVGLGSSTTTPAAALETTIQDLLQNGGDPAALSAVTGALSTSGLTTLLSGLSSSSSALSELGGLQSLLPGASVPAGGLGGLATLLTAIGTAAPGAASALQQALSLLNSNSALSPADLQTLIGDLTSVAAGSAGSTVLSSTSGTTVQDALNALVAQLQGSGSLFGALAGAGVPLSPTQITGVLGELASLDNLTSGSTVAPLTNLSALLKQLASAPGVSSIAVPNSSLSLSGFLNQLATAIGGGQLSLTDLAFLGTALNGVTSLLPAPLNGIASSLGGTIVSKLPAAIVGTGTTGTTGTGTGTGTGSKTGTTGSTTTGKLPTTTAAKPFAYGIFAKSSRAGTAGRRVTVKLFCYASTGQTCSSTIKLTGSKLHSVTKTLKFKVGRYSSYTATLKPAGKPAKKAKRTALHLVVRSGAYRVTKTLK